MKAKITKATFVPFLAINNEILEESRTKSEKAAFSRQLLMAIVEILIRECQKEERTKQGEWQHNTYLLMPK